MIGHVSASLYLFGSKRVLGRVEEDEEGRLSHLSTAPGSEVRSVVSISFCVGPMLNVGGIIVALVG